MDELYARLVEYPHYSTSSDKPAYENELDGSLKKLLKLLNTTPGSRLLGKVSGNRGLLDTLQLPNNTIPFLHTLLAHIQHEGLAPGSALWIRAQEFVLTFDSLQIRYSGHEFRRLLETIADAAGKANNLNAAILLIQCALLRLDPATSTFTSLHLLFVRLCLKARAWAEALPILDNDIYHYAQDHIEQYERQNRALCSRRNTSATFITKETGFTSRLAYQNHLSYHLYGAMLYMLAKNYGRALELLEIVMTAPTPGAASMIQAEAYKKWILVQLLEYGKVPQMPRGVTSQVSKHMRSLGKPYEALGETFKNPDSQKLRNEIEIGQHFWLEDCNAGLVVMLHSAHQRFALLALSKIYASLPMSAVYDLAFPKSVTLEEAHTYIANLITSNQLSASLQMSNHDPASSILRFDELDSFVDAEGNEVDRTPELQAQQVTIDAITGLMRDSRHRLETSKHYHEALAKARRAEAEGKSNGAGLTNGMDWLNKGEELLDTM